MGNPFETLDKRLTNIENLLLSLKHGSDQQTESPPQDTEVPLGADAAAQFLGVSRQTLYQNVGKIPHRKRFGRLYFFKNELLAYLDAGKDLPESL